MIPQIPGRKKIPEKSGNFYGPKTTYTGGGSVSATIYYYPVVIDSALISALRVFFSSGMYASFVRLALYSDNGGKPGSLIIESAQLLAGASNDLAINMTLSGCFWMAFQVDTGHGSAATVGTYEDMGITGTGQKVTHYTQAQAFGAFPATAGTLTTATAAAGGYLALVAA